MTTEGPRPYQVALSGLVRDQLQELILAAAREGRRAEVTADAAALHRALTWVPEIVAEPVFDLPTLGRVQVGSFRSIQLRIAVNDDRRQVFVSWFRLRPAETD